MNILTDVMMLILPIPVIWKIQTSKTVKLGLILTIATGSRLGYPRDSSASE